MTEHGLGILKNFSIPSPHWAMANYSLEKNSAVGSGIETIPVDQ